MAKNPIRKVVVMLQGMEKKITEEGKKAEALYEKAMCFCKDGGSSLQSSVSAAEEKIPNLEFSIKEARSTHQQLAQDLTMHKQSRAEAQKGVETAVALREKNAASYAKESGELKTNIKSLTDAVTSLKSTGAGFLQASGAAVVRRLTLSMDMDDSARQVMANFLASKGRLGAGAPAAEIVGILGQMKDEMAKELSEVEAQEAEEISNHEALVAAKQKEIAAATKAVEAKTERVGDLAVRIVELDNDLVNTKDGLAEDEKFLANLDKSCKLKKAEWVEYQKTMAAEKVALGDTIKILNDDDALELFKKTLPSAAAAGSAAAASFLQLARTEATAGRRKQAALRLLRRGRGAAHGGDARVSMLAIALRGQKHGFDMVIKECEELAKILGVEQKDDDAKKAFCEKELDKVEDEKKAFDRAVADRLTGIAQVEDSLKGVEAEIAALAEGVRTLDADVEKQTAQRKAEHKEYGEVMASNGAAKDLLQVAKNRLQKFYNPRLAKEAPKRKLSEEDSIVVSMGGTAPPTPAPGGIAGTGIKASLLQRPDEAEEDGEGDEATGPAPVAENGADEGDESSEATGPAPAAENGADDDRDESSEATGPAPASEDAADEGASAEATGPAPAADDGEEATEADEPSDPRPAAFLQISADPGPMPEADLSYKKSGEESGGVMAMIDLLVRDLEKDMTVAETSEKNAQADYEEYMKDSGDKRMMDSKMISEKEAIRAELKTKLHTDREALRSEKAEVTETAKGLVNLHRECDWLLSKYQLRKDARAAEVDNLRRAQAVLSGADYA